MKTYQDLEKAKAGGEKELISFMLAAINDHKSSEMYKTAVEADLYMRKRNSFITNFTHMVENAYGEKIASNDDGLKCVSAFFPMFVIKQNQYLLGNGVTFEKEDTKKKLGGDDFDTKTQFLGEYSLWSAVSFGFYNNGKIEKFKLLEFAPLWDEENNSLRGGIRFWQIDPQKPLRVVLYEMDGYTEYIQRNGEEMTIFVPKRPYRQKVYSTEKDGVIAISDGKNYPAFPIVPFWGNPEHQSELIGIKSQIDIYDIIKSGFAADEQEAATIYWTISNAGGMDKKDLEEFVKNLRVVRAANTNEETNIQSHTTEVPYQSREVYLNRLENDMYRDFMALDIRGISAGNNTATAIRAAYEAINSKTDRYEYCVIEFIKGILEVAGIEDTPTFKRSMLINETEVTNMVLAAANYLDDRTILEHLPFLSIDEIKTITKRRAEEEMGRYEDTTAEEQEEMAQSNDDKEIERLCK